eukprot:TRINITY_DN2143_c0_g1_i4.p2 TRINITY_DN2143_c0_g1~~TRINITY_DN2143_c0_g1_i4.p2  ORF type:complete len:379 (-),score=27.49 TRINITY_DN2143_c0_g1_i4:666-1802(-)
MPANIEQWWIDTYEENVLHALQQKDSRLSGCVSPGTMKGKRRRFNYLGEAEMTEMTGRNEDTIWTDDEFFNRWITARRFSKSSIIEDEDVMRAFTEPNSDLVQAAVFAGRRQKDKVIIEAMNAVAYTGEDAETAVSLPDSQKLNVQLGSPLGAPANTGMNLAKILEAKFLLDDADIDDDIPRFYTVTATQLKELLNTTEIKNADYNNVKALAEGKIDTFAGFKFIRVSSKIIPWANNIRVNFAWARDSVKFAVSKDIHTKCAELPSKNFNLGVQTRMRVGAVRLFDKGVVYVPCAEVHQQLNKHDRFSFPTSGGSCRGSRHFKTRYTGVKYYGYFQIQRDTCRSARTAIAQQRTYRRQTSYRRMQIHRYRHGSRRRPH